MKLFSFCLLATFALSLAGCASKNPGSVQDRKTHFIQGSSHNKLEILDWGGEGSAMLFLAGMGNTAHVFQEFAPRFTDKFHVLGLTRRGFGRSDQPKLYDIDVLTGDILAVLDSLKIEKVILVGHSVAGEEITKFVGLYPERVEKIVYIDAAYDRTGSDSLFAEAPAPPQQTIEDSASIENLQRYYSAVNGIILPEEEIREISLFSKEGRYLGDKTGGEVFGEIIKGTIKPEYDKIKCPALAIYSVNDSAKELLPYYDKLDSNNASKADKLFDIFSRLGAAERDKFKTEVANSRVEVIKGGNHYLFISHPSEVEKMMRKFL